MNCMKRWMVDKLGNSFKENVLDLFDKTYDRAYELGYRDGSNDNNSDYYKGLEDAWECLKRIIGMGEPEEICEAGGLRNFVCKYSAQEAIDKVNEYCKQKKETMSVLEIAKRMIYEVIENTDDWDNFIWIMGKNTKDKLTSEAKKIYMSYDFPFYEVSKLYGIEIKDTLLDDPNGLCLISKNAYKQTKYEEING